MHEASTETLTLYGLHERRGRQGIDALGVLPGFTGVAVHDGWAPYRAYTGCEHALCNGHHLRELTGAQEEKGQAWAAAMADLLLELKTAVEAAKDAGTTTLEAQALAGYRVRYRQAIAAGYARNPEPAPSGKRGRPRQGPVRSLLLRLDRHQDDVLRFPYDFAVPFDNNLAERDIRMIKLQQKISGCCEPRGSRRLPRPPQLHPNRQKARPRRARRPARRRPRRTLASRRRRALTRRAATHTHPMSRRARNAHRLALVPAPAPQPPSPTERPER